VLLLNLHHIVSDGWSMGVLTRDMQALYAAQLEGRAAALPELTVQYADVTYWQRRQDMTAHRAYWTQALAGYAPGLNLPYDRAPKREASPARTLIVTYPAELSARLARFSLEQGATLFMSLAAALAVVLQRYSARDDLCLGTTVAGRDNAQLEGLIGFFVNIVTLRVDLSGDPAAKDLLQRIKQTALSAFEHQALPFEHVLHSHGLAGDAATQSELPRSASGAVGRGTRGAGAAHGRAKRQMPAGPAILW
jgi:hypothetical protein